MKGRTVLFYVYKSGTDNFKTEGRIRVHNNNSFDKMYIIMSQVQHRRF